MDLFLNITEAVLAALAGMCIFSFLNVVIYRVPRHMNFITGRSHCTRCGHALSGLDMIPVVSWLCLRGKCRYCKAPVSARYTVVELLGGMLALLSVYQYGFQWKALTVFAFFAVLTAVAFVDADTMEIPDGFVIAAALVGVISIFVFPEISLVSRLIGIVCVSGPMLLLAMLIAGGFGGGDIKLMAACGIFMGWKISLLAMFFAALAGGAYGVILMARKKAGRKSQFAFGPFLCVGMAAAFLWGEKILNWYLGMYGL